MQNERLERMKAGSRGRSVVDRLRDLQGQPPCGPARSPAEPPAGGERAADVAALRRVIAGIQQKQTLRRKPRPPQRVAIQDVVPGNLVQTPHGEVFVSTAEFPMTMQRGRIGPRLHEALRPLGRPLAVLAREESLADTPLADLVYFDTETTGLATTAGTYVFLAGLGYADESLFVVEQFFMRDYDEEPALLWLLGERLSQFNGIVTYNGRAFDLPLVQARYVSNRIFDPPLPKYHVDMLHPARRLWRARGAGCRLTELEREVLGFEREGDVPGYLIPGIYFDAVHRGNVAPLKAVFYHNVQDIVSLAALTVAGAGLLTAAEPPPDALGEDIYSVARFLEESGQPEAVEIYRRAFQWGFRNSILEKEAQCRLGRLHRRRGEQQEALRILAAVAESGGPFGAFALVELAKHLEHREKDYHQAYVVAVEALRTVRSLESTARSVPAVFRLRPADVEHRVRRLDARRQGKPWHARQKPAEGPAPPTPNPEP
jgi:hypothetical protein